MLTTWLADYWIPVPAPGSPNGCCRMTAALSPCCWTPHYLVAGLQLADDEQLTTVAAAVHAAAADAAGVEEAAGDVAG